ncbi:MAG: nucleotidyltransferase family protein, partial [Pseudobutyrivibrio sp.]|nr:nucleotidyltransferase family protein [Pseudobutyrivibrio sp.]
YQNEETNHMIELHTSVYEDFEGKKIEMLRAAELEAPSKRIYVDIDGERVRTLGHNEHLVYQMFHIIKHFMLEGAKIRFFTDITLFVNRYYDELSKEYFWDMMDKLNYGYFCENFMTICVEYFGMKPEFLAGRKAKASKEVLEAMIVDFIYKGDESQLRSENWQLTATLEPYLTGEITSVNSSKSGRIIRFIFPKSNELGERYTYAKKYPVLLPIAWIHRFGYKIIWQLFERQEEQYTAMEKMEVVENRLGLMSSVGLLDEE